MSLFEPKTPKNQGIKHKERGGALIWILIMVALFASLTYAVNQGSRGGVSQISEQQARLAATEILEYSRQIKEAVRSLQINGCSDTEISFDQAVVSGYSNPNAPTDNSCHVFHPNGGGLRYTSPPHGDEWYFNGVVGISNIGNYQGNCASSSDPSACAELLIRTIIPIEQEPICTSINKLAHNNLNAPPVNSTFTGPSFTFNGSYTGAYVISGDYTGKTSGCYQHPGGNGAYIFYQVLIAR